MSILQDRLGGEQFVHGALETSSASSPLEELVAEPGYDIAPVVLGYERYRGGGGKKGEGCARQVSHDDVVADWE